MNILGLDIASQTGWCVLKDDTLTNYGVISIPGPMNLFQKLSFFEANLKKVLEDNEIDFCCIEDVILGASGVKTLSYLSRLNGVALLSCYNKVKDNIRLYTPPYWKGHSFPGLNGKSQKVEVLLEVCRKYQLIDDTGYSDLINKIKNIQSYVEGIQITLKHAKNHQSNLKKDLARKRNPLTDYEKEIKQAALTDIIKQISELESDLKNSKKKIVNDYTSVALEITAKCGLTTDVSDSIGIARCGYLELSNEVQN